MKAFFGIGNSASRQILIALLSGFAAAAAQQFNGQAGESFRLCSGLPFAVNGLQQAAYRKRQ